MMKSSKDSENPRSAAQRGIPVQVNALATLVFVIALLVVLIAQFVSYRKRKNLQAL